jgi:hypothetical protein
MIFGRKNLESSFNEHVFRNSTGRIYNSVSFYFSKEISHHSYVTESILVSKSASPQSTLFPF